MKSYVPRIATSPRVGDMPGIGSSSPSIRGDGMRPMRLMSRRYHNISYCICEILLSIPSILLIP